MTTKALQTNCDYCAVARSMGTVMFCPECTRNTPEGQEAICRYFSDELMELVQRVETATGRAERMEDSMKIETKFNIGDRVSAEVGGVRLGEYLIEEITARVEKKDDFDFHIGYSVVNESGFRTGLFIEEDLTLTEAKDD